MALPDDKRHRRSRAPGDASPLPGDEPAGTPSKTRRKAAMHELQDLGEALVALDARRLRELASEAELPERLVDAIVEARSITAWGARKRQLQYVGRLMRDIDPAPVRRRLDAWAHGHDQDTARQHALEQLREELLRDPSALEALIAARPGLDRRRLATLIAQARSERNAGAPPHAYRELFRQLKFLDHPPP
jgi:ribosome-associated protein